MLVVDTNTISYYFRGDPQVVPRLQALRPADLGVPAIVEYELRYGLERLPPAAAALRQSALTQLLQAMLDMSTSAQIRESLGIGQTVLGQLARLGRLHKPAVEQAGFAVLKAPDIPSILVETAFISNPQEEALLREPEYQAQLADALANAIRRHFARRPPTVRRRST